MCVIVVKPKDKRMSEELIRACWDSNPDGAGVSYVNKGNVIIDKGIMTVDELIKKINKLQNKKLVVHFRYATHGLVDEGNTHPFPVSHFHEELRKKKIRTSVAVHHNGVIRGVKNDKVLSDSQVFIRDVLTMFSDEDLKIGRADKKMLDTGCKFAIMFNDGTVDTVGSWFSKDGFQFSNMNWSWRI